MPQSISLTLPVSQAVYRVKRLLFEPFDFGKWFVIGFCAWLAELGRGGVGAGLKFKGGNPAAIAAKVQQAVEQGQSYVLLHLSWIVPLAATIALLGLAFWGLVLWLSSRGQFMFLHCVALERAEIRAPWTQYARQGHSLFLFRAVLTLLALLFTFPVQPLLQLRRSLATLEKPWPAAPASCAAVRAKSPSPICCWSSARWPGSRSFRWSASLPSSAWPPAALLQASLSSAPVQKYRDFPG